MNESDAHNDSPPEQVEHALIETLLHAAWHPDPASDAQRVARALEAIRSPQSLPSPAAAEETVSVPEPSLRSPGRLHPRWTGWVAASLVVAATLVGLGIFQMQSAAAAVARTLRAAESATPHHYRVTVEFRRPVTGDTQVVSDLYVRGHDAFALRHPALLPHAEWWIGRQAGESWIAPPRGPVRVGTDTALDRWLAGREEISTPYLQITTILRRLQRGYRLETLADEDLQIGDRAIPCQHIRGQLRNPQAAGPPREIEVWAARDSGLALRLTAEWAAPVLPRGRLRIRVDYLDSEPLPDNFFEHTAHHAPQRPVETLNLDPTETFAEPSALDPSSNSLEPAAGQSP